MLGASPVGVTLRKVPQKIHRLNPSWWVGKGEMVGQEPTSSVATRWLGKPLPVQGQIGEGQE